jgi:hypothetical protein
MEIEFAPAIIFLSAACACVLVSMRKDNFLALLEFQQQYTDCEENEYPNACGNKSDVNIFILNLPSTL